MTELLITKAGQNGLGNLTKVDCSSTTAFGFALNLNQQQTKDIGQDDPQEFQSCTKLKKRIKLNQNVTERSEDQHKRRKLSGANRDGDR